MLRPMTRFRSPSASRRGARNRCPPTGWRRYRCAPSNSTGPWRPRTAGYRLSSFRTWSAWNLDELDGGLVELLLVLAVAAPVGVGLLDDDLPFLYKALQHFLYLEIPVHLPRNPRGGSQIDKNCELMLFFVHLSLLVPDCPAFSCFHDIQDRHTFTSFSGETSPPCLETLPRA